MHSNHCKSGVTMNNEPIRNSTYFTFLDNLTFGSLFCFFVLLSFIPFRYSETKWLRKRIHQHLVPGGKLPYSVSTDFRYRFLNFEERVNKVDASVQIATLQYSRRAETVLFLLYILICRLRIIQRTSWRNSLKSVTTLISVMILFTFSMRSMFYPICYP